MRKAVGFFCNASCQKVSFEKSRVFCSPNLHSNFAAVLATIYGSSVTKNLEKFCGFPLINSRVAKATIYDLLRRSKNNFLPGKIRFFPSLVELLSYNLSRRLFLSALCKLWNFQHLRTTNWIVWIIISCGGTLLSTLNVHLVNWATVCHRKGNGGLGFQKKKKTANMNKACSVTLVGDCCNMRTAFGVSSLLLNI